MAAGFLLIVFGTDAKPNGASGSSSNVDARLDLQEPIHKVKKETVVRASSGSIPRFQAGDRLCPTSNQSQVKLVSVSWEK
jgi:hypothetical protein